MKRDSPDVHKSHAAVGEEARARLKHQTLLQEYLELQKDFVSKKRKLQATTQKRDFLAAEVRFLRQRWRYLLKVQSPKLEVENGLVHAQNSIMQSKLERERKYSAYGAALENSYPILVSNPNMRDEEEGEGEEVVVSEALRVGKKPKSHLLDDKRVGKKKISWQDPVTLEV